MTDKSFKPKSGAKFAHVTFNTGGPNMRCTLLEKKCRIITCHLFISEIVMHRVFLSVSQNLSPCTGSP